MKQQFYMLTEEGIKTLAQEISATIESKLQAKTVATSKKNFYTIDELSKLIGVAKSTIYGRVNRNTIPHIKKGNLLRFSEEDILKWLEEGKSTSKSDAETRANDYLAKKDIFNR